jgi:erythromycin esterase-like protein
MGTRSLAAFNEPDISFDLVNSVRSISFALHGWEDLDPLIERIGDARFVLLGEASHGTAEYYDWRRLISARLIREKDFSFIAVEGDWPDCYRVNRYVKGYTDAGANAKEVLGSFERWPTWMWANEEVALLMEWLQRYNRELAADRKAGFYGLDVYSLWESMHAVLDYLEKHDEFAAAAARQAFDCFEPYGYDVDRYARGAPWTPHSCEDEMVQLLSELRKQTPTFDQDGDEAHFNAEQNAIVARNAEEYYRTMLAGEAPSWNLRDHHMAETLHRLVVRHGPQAKAIVWAHNTHVGDARSTDMAAGGMINLGQLVRENHPSGEVYAVGFSSYRGSVVAGASWGAGRQRMPLPPARVGSWEHVLHNAHEGDRLVILDQAAETPQMLEPRGHRAVGVVYHPAYEARGNYVPSVLPKRYDALAFFDHTNALHPLPAAASFERELPETYPTGV